MTETSRDEAPDIPETPKDLLVRLFTHKFFKNIGDIESFRSDFPIGLQGRTLDEFIDSAVFRRHVKKMEELMATKGTLMPEHAHEGVRAEERRAAQIAVRRTDVAGPVMTMLEEAEAA